MKYYQALCAAWNNPTIKLALDVPAVCGGFAVAIKERGAFQQPQNCGGEKPFKGACPTAVLRSPIRRKALEIAA